MARRPWGAMTLPTTAGVAAVLASTCLVTACAGSGSAPDAAAPPSTSRPSSAASATSDAPSERSSPSAPRPTRGEVHAAVTALRHYLDAWVTEGPARASRHLVESQRSASDQGSPRISAGTVSSYRVYSWKGPEEFTLLVSMDLAFTNDPGAWDRGTNERFVTAHRVGDHGTYLLELATSP